MDIEMIDKVLKLHGEWLESDGARGCRAMPLGHIGVGAVGLSGKDLSYAIMDGVYAQCACLQRTRLHAASMRKVNLTGATLRDADLRGANLSGADLCCTNLTCANFQNANLENADLRGANLSGSKFHGANLAGVNVGGYIIPTVDRLDETILKIVESGEGRLDMANWHGGEGVPSCNTTHCRAGWAIELAGPDGYELEHSLVW